MIDSSTFGSITIDGAKYNHDVYILPSGQVEARGYGHTFTKEQTEHVLVANPEAVVIGKGIWSRASLDTGARALLEERGIEIIEANTSEATELFNELSKTKKVAAIIHVTC